MNPSISSMQRWNYFGWTWKTTIPHHQVNWFAACVPNWIRACVPSQWIILLTLFFFCLLLYNFNCEIYLFIMKVQHTYTPGAYNYFWKFNTLATRECERACQRVDFCQRVHGLWQHSDSYEGAAIATWGCWSWIGRRRRSCDISSVLTCQCIDMSGSWP